MERAYTAIWNPTANRGRAARWAHEMEDACRRAGVDAEFVESRSPEHLGEVAVDAAEQGRTPVAMGGDGTVNLVINALGETGATLAIAPAGTGNALAGELGIPERDPDAIAEILRAGESRDIEIAEITHEGGTHLAASVISMGIAADVTEQAERIDIIKGDLRYVVSVFPTLARTEPYEFTISTDGGEEREVRAWMIMVANVKDAGGGMRITPDAEVDDGFFDVCTVGPVSKLHFLRTFPKVFRGVHVEEPHVSIERVRSIRLSTERRSVCYADGDRLAELPIEIVVRPRSLSVVA